VNPRVATTLYEVNPVLLDMLYNKQFLGDDSMEDLYAYIDSLKLFVDR
jgi:hypothetical protein